MVGKVAIIGAGPCGMELLRHFARQKCEGKVIPEVKCFEKCRDWGGQWNYTWRNGTDEFGEVVNSSMYRYLWSNGPKECIEFPDYTFEEHFGKPIPSFPPREVVFDYLKGRWKQANVRDKIAFCHAVKDVCYNSATDDFTVVVKDLENDVVLDGERFDYVIVASGHYSLPNVPSFPGLEIFSGNVSHSHDFRDAKVYAGKTVLLIGASYSAEDIAMQLVKYGATNVICSWRTRPMAFKLPDNVQQRPLLLRMDGNTAHFKDGSSLAVDAVILCTGYKHSYPFLRDNLRLKSGNVFYTPNLYKGIVWTKGGNGKLLYVSSQDNAYTFTLFDVQARDAKVYAGKTVLLIGASYSAEDISMQLVKYGATNVICGWRTRPMAFKLPDNVQQKPLLMRMDGNTAHFKDGSSAAVDAVIMCTGYKHSYPFLRDNLRLKSGNVFYTPNLYKGIVWTKGGNGKLLYVSSQDNAYTFTLFDVQARWAVKLIQGEISLPTMEDQNRSGGAGRTGSRPSRKPLAWSTSRPTMLRTSSRISVPTILTTWTWAPSSMLVWATSRRISSPIGTKTSSQSSRELSRQLTIPSSWKPMMIL